MHQIAYEPPTEEQRKQFEKEALRQRQEEHSSNGKVKSRRGKGEKARNRRQYSR